MFQYFPINPQRGGRSRDPHPSLSVYGSIQLLGETGVVQIEMNSERTPRVRSKIVDSARCGFVPQTDTNPPGMQTMTHRKTFIPLFPGSLRKEARCVQVKPEDSGNKEKTKRKQRGKSYRNPRKSNDKGEEFSF